METELTSYEEQLVKLTEKIDQLEKDLEESSEAAAISKVATSVAAS